MYRIEIEIPDIPLYNPEKFKREIQKQSIKTVDRVTTVQQTRIKLRTPVGVSSELINNILTERKVFARRVEGEVNTGNAQHAPVVELGRKKAFAPIQPLEDWVRLSSGGQSLMADINSTRSKKLNARQIAFMISNSMAKRARKGQKFFAKGLADAKSEVDRIVERFWFDIKDL